MTKSDFERSSSEPSDGAIILRRALLGIGGGITLVFIAGMIAGYTSVLIEQDGLQLVDFAILAAMLFAAALVGYGMWRLWPRGIDEPVSPRVKGARNLFGAAFILGGVLGIALIWANGGSGDLLANTPIQPGLAIFAIALLITGGPLLTWLWWRKIDEHEADAYRDGALIAVHAYIFIAPAWWLASRAGWVPPQEPMSVVFAVCGLWTAVWFFRRYF